MWILTKQLITSPFVQDTKALEWDSETFGQMCEKSLMWRSKPSQSRTWRQRLKRVGYIRHLFTRTLKPSHSNTFLEKWISSLPDSRVNPLVLPEDENQQMIRDIYTHTSLKESHSVDQLMLFSKMSKESSQAKPQTENRYSNMSSETWKKEVMSQRGEYSQRLKLVRPINENESLSWPTARNSDAEGGRIETEMSKKGFRSKRHKSDQYFGAKLRDAVETHEEKNWPTPASRDHKGGHGTIKETNSGHVRISNKTGTKFGARLDAVVEYENEKNWATPKAKEKSWPTPAAHEARLGYQKRHKGAKGTQKSLTTIVIEDTQQDQEKSSTSGKSQGRLNPNWVEQLMGLPVGWTQLPTEWIG